MRALMAITLAFFFWMTALAASKHDFTLFKVHVGDLVCIARETKDAGQRMIVGDPIQVSIDGDALIFLKPDGREMKTTIMKRVRAQDR
ncbi:MAG: hypothetical protein ABI165_05640 [Bryobacteraceae bacterium]